MKQKGFTLIELIIVFAIISILASIAIPAFEEYKAKKAQHVEEKHVIEDKAPTHRIPTIP